MAIIKCKMCGGDIVLNEEKTIGTCEYCGTQMTLPKVSDEQRAALFNRGNHFRRTGEFDKALAIYENIVREDDADAEAHWCCALCRFGIEYVEDPNTFEFIPTCHRASFDSFLDDVDYLAALEHSDGITRRQYQKDGAKIAEVQKGILATSQNEEPFDVFICYKETDDNTKERTKDSIDAQEIYYQLTNEGYRVFFSRITLEDKAGAEYEPYIFAALNSAKVMIAIGSKPEYFNAVWVKNEWSRFLALMRKDRSKLLLPCYKGMDPYDLPEQLSVLQSFDMAKIGFIQDLIRGVKKVIRKDVPEKAQPVQPVVQQPVQAPANTNLTAQLKRGMQALEDHDWQQAETFFDKALDLDAECAEAFFGKALAAAQCANGEEFAGKRLSISVTNTETITACEKDEAMIERSVAENTVPGYLEKANVRDCFAIYNRTFQSRTAAWKKRIADENKHWETDKLLSRAARYAKGDFAERLNAVRSKIGDSLKTSLDESIKADGEMKKQTAEQYSKAMEQASIKVVKLRKDAEEKRLAEYEKACRMQEEAKTVEDFGSAKYYFEKQGIKGFKDSDERAEQCKEAIERLHVLAAKKAKQKKKRNLIITIAVIAFVILAIAAYVVITKVIIPEVRNKANYALAEKLIEEGNVAEAAAKFSKLGEYSDSKIRCGELWDKIAVRQTIAAGPFYTVGLKEDGSVYFVGKMGDIQFTWHDIIAISAGSSYTVGLKADGTVLAAGDNSCGQCNVSDWSSIVAISAGSFHTVGLKSDGTVIAVGRNDNNQCDVSAWTDIIAISAGYDHTAGLKLDGTVVAVGKNDYNQCDVSAWTDIIAISAGYDHTVGLKSDGTVVAVGRNDYNQCSVSAWTDVIAVSAGPYSTLGIKSNGTVIAVGKNDNGQCNVSELTDIVAISAGYNHTVALKADGTVIGIGWNSYGQLDVSEWKNIKIPDRIER